MSYHTQTQKNSPIQRYERRRLQRPYRRARSHVLEQRHLAKVGVRSELLEHNVFAVCALDSAHTLARHDIVKANATSASFDDSLQQIKPKHTLEV